MADAAPRTPPADDSAVADLPGFHHRYAEVNGVRIHYVIGGEGPAVVLLHGFPYSWEVWRELMPLLAQAGSTVLAPDLRGMGDSGPADNDTFAKTNVAQDVREIVHGLQLGPVDLVGMDIGTMVAYAWVSRHPAEVRRLVLSESLIPGFGLEELMNPATGGYWHFGFQMQVDLAAFLTQGKEEAYLLPFYRVMSAAPNAEARARSAYLPHVTGLGGLKGALHHYGPLLEDGRDNRAAFAGKLPMPVLVLGGERGLPQEPLLEGARQVAERVEAASGGLGRVLFSLVCREVRKQALVQEAQVAHRFGCSHGQDQTPQQPAIVAEQRPLDPVQHLAAAHGSHRCR